MVRTLIGIAVAAAVVALGAIVVALTRAPKNAADTSSAASSTGGGHPVTITGSLGLRANLVYGMTSKQVLARVGKPDKTVRDHGVPCWQYNINHAYQGLDGAGHTYNAVRICFVSGRYSLNWQENDGKWDYILPKVHFGS